MNEDQLENPVLGYVVIAAALVVGMLSATVFGQAPTPNAVPHRSQAATAGAPKMAVQSPHWTEPPQTQEPSSNDKRPTGDRRWILGVRSTPSTTGCVITSVISCSPAERVGLAAGDRILAVNGRQVGWMNQKLTPLHQAIDAAPHRCGQLLVQRANSGAVHAMSIRMSTIAESLGH